MTLIDLWGYVRDGGTLFVLLLIIVTGFRGDWAWSWYIKELRDQNKELREDIKALERRLDRATGVAERQSENTARATRLVARHLDPAEDSDA